MIKYFINFTVRSSDGRCGEGSANVNRTSPITDIEDIRAIEENLMVKDKDKYESVHITNWRRFE